MKRLLYYLAISLFFGLVISSCVTEIKIDEISLKEEINLNGLCVAGEPISVSLLLTTPRICEMPMFNDTILYKELENATVKLWVNGVETEQMNFIPADVSTRWDNIDYTDSSALVCLGFYKGQTICQPGKTYKIEVTHPEYETVTCETKVPNEISKIDIADVDIHSISTSKSGYSAFKITITDTPNEKNYYRIFITSKKGNRIDDHNGGIDSSNIVLVWNDSYWNYELQDPLLFPEKENANDLILGTTSNFYNLFSDEFIDGKTHIIDFNANNYNVFQRELVKGEFYSITVNLQVINEDEYLYLKSLTLYQHFNDEFLAEPVQVYSNIKNGVGIFSGAINYSRTFQYGAYPVEGMRYYYSKFGNIQYSLP